MLGLHGRIAQVEQLTAEIGEGRQPCHGAREIEDRGRRDVSVLGGDRSLDRREAAGLRLAPDGGHQAGLSDPGLAGEQEELAPTGGDVVKTPIRKGEQVVTPDEERAPNGPQCGVHRQ